MPALGICSPEVVAVALKRTAVGYTDLSTRHTCDDHWLLRDSVRVVLLRQDCRRAITKIQCVERLSLRVGAAD